MELLQLKYFQKAAEFENISAAAAYFGIPQPAMSQSIARLERELDGVKLFDRKNNRLYLNENGRVFLHFARQALQSLEDARRAVTSDRKEISGPIRVLALENRRLVLSCVSKFAREHQNVNFQVVHNYSDNQDAVYDLCISSSMAYRQMRHGQPLIQEKIVLAVYEEHPLANRERVRLEELRNEKFITPSTRSSIYAVTLEHCRKAGFEPQISFVCDDPYFVRKYISEQMGVAFAPSVSWAGRFRENTRLIPIENPSMVVTSYLLWDDDRWQSCAVQAFRDFLMQEAQALPGNALQKP